MATTIEQYRTRLAEDYTRDPNNKIWNLSAVDRAINKGYTQVQKDLLWTEGTNEDDVTRSTVVGSELYDLPADFIRIKLVRYNGDDLVETTRKEVKRMDDTSQSGTPRWYYTYNNKLGLYPVPDAEGTVDLEYYKSEATISTAQDSQMPAIIDDAVLLYAAYKLFMGVQNVNAANMFRNDYEDEMNKLRLTLLFDDENARVNYERFGYQAREDVLGYMD